jgi:hypothetical protein
MMQRNLPRSDLTSRVSKMLDADGVIFTGNVGPVIISNAGEMTSS